MFNYIIEKSIRYRYLVVVLTLVIAFLGVISYQNLIIDAVPDITNVQVQINTEALGYSPFEVEKRVTQPIELAISGMPNLENFRSISRYGLSQVTAIFSDDTDIYFARQLITQRLLEVRERLPKDINPTLGPIATGLGEIFMYTVESVGSKQRTLEELREVQDWLIKPQLKSIKGVVDVNSIGGASKQILINPKIDKILAYELTLKDLSLAISKNNNNVGAGFIEKQGEQLLMRVTSQADKFQDLEQILVKIRGDSPILVKDIADVTIGSELRTGAATENGKEVVLGTVFMLMGENGRIVSNAVKEKLDKITISLPKGIKINPIYNRSNLVNATIKTVKSNLFEGAILVIFILFLALGNFRAALITACVIPLSFLLTITGMLQTKMSANLMSLGALDFGLIVDGAVILVENCITRFAEAEKQLGRLITKSERLNLVKEASLEVRNATVFGELIIMIVYLPILTLSGIEGKMYNSMAVTVLIALSAAFLLSLTFVPASIAIFLNNQVLVKHSYILKLQNIYKIILLKLIKIPALILTITAILFLLSILTLTQLGSEFLPTLDEGDIAMHALRIPSTGLNQSIKMQHQLENVIKKVPEVSHVFAKIGTAEIATDPMPPSVADGFVILKPRSEWLDSKKPKSLVVSEIEKLVLAVPGNNYEFTQPIQMRFNELISGVRSDVAVKIFGDDTRILLEAGEKVRDILTTIEGAADAKVEQVTGLPMIVVKPNAQKLARFGLSSFEIQDTINTLYAGKEVSRFYEGDRNFPIVVRLAEEDRSNTDLINKLTFKVKDKKGNLLEETFPRDSGLIPDTHNYDYITLKDVASIDFIEGPNQISRENGKRRVVTTVNVRGRDLGSFVEETQAKIDRELKLPPNYWLEWGGQYEHLLSAKHRLYTIIPLILLSVFLLIYYTLRSLKYSLLVLTGIPFGLSGGIFALWLRGIPFSISAAVGFIALSGISVLNGLVLVSFISKRLEYSKYYLDSIIDGSLSRIRPVLMTAMVASLGFIPMALSQGTGSEVQRPLATVVIGGIISSTILTLIVIPVVIVLIEKKSS
jgi:heavy metal efflux system protein